MRASALECRVGLLPKQKRPENPEALMPTGLPRPPRTNVSPSATASAKVMPLARLIVAAQHDETRPRLVQFHQEVAKIVEQLDHARVRGTKWTGMSPRDRGTASMRARLKASTVSRVSSEIAAAPLTGLKSTSTCPTRPLCKTITLARFSARSRRACSSGVTLRACHLPGNGYTSLPNAAPMNGVMIPSHFQALPPSVPSRSACRSAGSSTRQARVAAKPPRSQTTQTRLARALE